MNEQIAENPLVQEVVARAPLYGTILGIGFLLMFLTFLLVVILIVVKKFGLKLPSLPKLPKLPGKTETTSEESISVSEAHKQALKYSRLLWKHYKEKADSNDELEREAVEWSWRLKNLHELGPDLYREMNGIGVKENKKPVVEKEEEA